MQAESGESILKEKERAKLAEDVAEFLRRGGSIEQVDVAYRAEDGKRRSPTTADDIEDE